MEYPKADMMTRNTETETEIETETKQRKIQKERLRR